MENYNLLIVVFLGYFTMMVLAIFNLVYFIIY